MYWLAIVAALIGVAFLWGFAALLHWTGVRILPAVLVIVGIVWAVVYGWMAYEAWLTRPLG